MPDPDTRQTPVDRWLDLEPTARLVVTALVIELGAIVLLLAAVLILDFWPAAADLVGAAIGVIGAYAVARYAFDMSRKAEEAKNAAAVHEASQSLLNAAHLVFKISSACRRAITIAAAIKIYTKLTNLPPTTRAFDDLEFNDADTHAHFWRLQISIGEPIIDRSLIDQLDQPVAARVRLCRAWIEPTVPRIVEALPEAGRVTFKSMAHARSLVGEATILTKNARELFEYVYVDMFGHMPDPFEEYAQADLIGALELALREPVEPAQVDQILSDLAIGYIAEVQALARSIAESKRK